MEDLSRPGMVVQTSDMTSARSALDAVVDELLANPGSTADVSTQAPATSGLYAWWAPPLVLPELIGPTHPTQSDLRLLYIGLATKLRSRLASNHVRRSGSSTLRRTLAGLLLDEQGYRTRWTDRVVLGAVQEVLPVGSAQVRDRPLGLSRVSWRGHEGGLR